MSFFFNFNTNKRLNYTFLDLFMVAVDGPHCLNEYLSFADFVGKFETCGGGFKHEPDCYEEENFFYYNSENFPSRASYLLKDY